MSSITYFGIPDLAQISIKEPTSRIQELSEDFNKLIQSILQENGLTIEASKPLIDYCIANKQFINRLSKEDQKIHLLLYLTPIVAHQQLLIHSTNIGLPPASLKLLLEMRKKDDNDSLINNYIRVFDLNEERIQFTYLHYKRSEDQDLLKSLNSLNELRGLGKKTTKLAVHLLKKNPTENRSTCIDYAKKIKELYDKTGCVYSEFVTISDRNLKLLDSLSKLDDKYEIHAAYTYALGNPSMPVSSCIDFAKKLKDLCRNHTLSMESLKFLSIMTHEKPDELNFIATFCTKLSGSVVERAYENFNHDQELDTHLRIQNSFSFLNETAPQTPQPEVDPELITPLTPVDLDLVENTALSIPQLEIGVIEPIGAATSVPVERLYFLPNLDEFNKAQTLGKDVTLGFNRSGEFQIVTKRCWISRKLLGIISIIGLIFTFGKHRNQIVTRNVETILELIIQRIITEKLGTYSPDEIPNLDHIIKFEPSFIDLDLFIKDTNHHEGNLDMLKLRNIAKNAVKKHKAASAA